MTYQRKGASSSGSIDRLWLPGTLGPWKASAGTPTASEAGARFPSLLLGISGTTTLNASFMVPTGWTAFDIRLYVAPNGTAAGNTIWTVVSSERADSEVLSAGDVTLMSAQIITHSAVSAELQVETISTAVAATPGELRHIRFSRLGADAGDTATDATHFVGVELVKA